MEIENFIKDLDLTLVILHKEANNGNTIIEKFEKNANEIVYAIILYTPCDRGYSIEEGDNNTKYRARQNVVFEHGYFIGNLRRKYVAAIKKDNVEVPSDLSGILYIVFDKDGAWKMKLAQEMKNVGLIFDFNCVL